MKESQMKLIKVGVVALVALLLLLRVNPFAWNDAGHRTIIETASGDQRVQFMPGIYFQGFFSKEKVYPNQISVSYRADKADYDLDDNTIEIGKQQVRFNDGSTAEIQGITQYILPAGEKEMIAMHNAHRSVESLVSKRLAPYTNECLKSAAQLMSAEMHYSGGRAQMSQDFSDQLQSGVFLLSIKEKLFKDSLDGGEMKRIYATEMQKDKNGVPIRKKSSIKEYGITVADAAITDVDYVEQVDQMIKKKIDAATANSIAKQATMTAQQQALAEKAKGEKDLIVTEYNNKQTQMKLVVEAETKVKVAEQDKAQQKVQAEAAELEAKKIKTLADAEAYRNQRLVSAGLTPQERAQFEMDTKIGVAEQLSKIALPTTYMSGSNGNGSASMLESIIGSKLLNLDNK